MQLLVVFLFYPETATRAPLTGQKLFGVKLTPAMHHPKGQHVGYYSVAPMEPLYQRSGH